MSKITEVKDALITRVETVTIQNGYTRDIIPSLVYKYFLDHTRVTNFPAFCLAFVGNDDSEMTDQQVHDDNIRMECYVYVKKESDPIDEVLEFSEQIQKALFASELTSSCYNMKVKVRATNIDAVGIARLTVIVKTYQAI